MAFGTLELILTVVFSVLAVVFCFLFFYCCKRVERPDVTGTIHWGMRPEEQAARNAPPNRRLDLTVEGRVAMPNYDERMAKLSEEKRAALLGHAE